MEDHTIIDLYFSRDESAITESARKYGRLCRGVSLRILGDPEDARETENDVYFRAWNAIPPARPASLGAFLCAVCRRLSIDRLRAAGRKKRGGDAFAHSLQELEDVADGRAADPAEAAALKITLERFLDGLSPLPRRVFLLRYWWMCSIREIASQCGMSESAVKMQLSRTRAQLKEELKEE